MFYHTTPLCPLRDDLHVIPLVDKILHTLHWRCVYYSYDFFFFNLLYKSILTPDCSYNQVTLRTFGIRLGAASND